MSARTLSRLQAWTLGVFGAILGVLAAGTLWYGLSSWQVTLAQAESRLAATTADVRIAVQNHLAAYAQGLAFLDRRIRRTKALAHPAILRSMLKDFERVMPGLAALNVVGRDGRVLVSTVLRVGDAGPDFNANPELRRFLARLRVHPDSLQLWHPMISPLTQTLVIHIGWAFRSARGVAFYLIGDLDLNHELVLYRSFLTARREARRMGFGVQDEAGYLFGRWPLRSIPDIIAFLQAPRDGAIHQAIAAHPDAGAGHIAGLLNAGRPGELYIGRFQRLKRYSLTAFTVEPRARILAGWWRRARIPLFSGLAAEFALIGLMFLTLRAQRRWAEESAAQIGAQERLVRFNAILAQVNEIIASAESEAGLFQSICDIIVRNGPMRLAYVARPDEAGRFRFVAAAGETGYLDGLLISADPERPEGRGSLAMSWREGRILYNQSFATTPFLLPWAARAARHGFGACATLPIRRAGAVDAVLAVYHPQEHIFDASLRAVLEALALDISRGLERLALLAAERRSHALNQVMLDNSAVGIILTQGRVIRQVNGRVLADFKAAGPEALIGRRTSEFYADPEESARIGLAIEAIFSAGGEARFEVRLRRLDGTPIWYEITGHRVEGEDFDQVWVVQDVNDRHAAQERLEHLAFHDSLTGLPNRLALERHLPEAIARAECRGGVLAVGLIDLDDFKPVNDTFGHIAGDQLLREMARRLQSRLRDGDLLVRLGGDEFIIVVETLAAERLVEQIESIMNRLHDAVETAIEVAPGRWAEVGMSAGVAICPGDATQGDTLLRLADATLYQVKAAKRNRLFWWGMAGAAVRATASEATLDPYGPRARQWLSEAGPDLLAAELPFIEAFYSRLQQNPSTAAILDLLSAAELAHLKARQRDHLHRTMSPDLGPEDHQRSAQRLGRIHAMMGIETAELIGAMEHYSGLLHHAVERLSWDGGTKLGLQSVIDARLSREFQNGQQGRGEIERERQKHLARLESEAPEWLAAGQFPARLAVQLAELSGIIGAGWGRPDTHNRHVIEHGAGCMLEYMAALQEAGLDLVFDPQAKAAQAVTLRAWGSACIETSASLSADPGFAPLAPVAKRFGIRSVAAIPVLDARGHPMAIITLLGAYPGQFMVPAMQLWLEAVQHLAGRMTQSGRDGTGGQPISAQHRRTMSELLFGTGLRMVMQPLVNLSSGAPAMMEALARLAGNGEIFGPGQFLPVFGTHELEHLFREGLDHSLSWLQQWSAQDVDLRLTINLPPSVLAAPDCVRWVRDALDGSGIAPARLYLELLETAEDAADALRRQSNITELAALGVKLVMDDLGSGYSSLQRLRTLPFSMVKIDQNLIRQANQDPARTVPFVGALVRMAQDLGLDVTVEGLETLDLVEMAACLGAEWGQGYALARPMAPEQVAAWVKAFTYGVDVRHPGTLLGRRALTYRRSGRSPRGAVS